MAAESQPSVGQTLLWFLDRYRGEEGALNCPTLCRIHGPVDKARVRSAVAEVMTRHESLRTTFTGGGRRLRALIADSASPPLNEVDLSGEPDPETAVEEAIRTELSTRIDPSESCVRLTLWKLAADHHVLCFNMHHMVTDAWSCRVVLQDLCTALDRTGNDAVPKAAKPYSEFAAEQRRHLASDAGKRLTSFWSEQLRDMTLAPLPMSRATPGAARRTDLVQDTLDADTTTALDAVARAERSTLFVSLLTAYYRALRQVSGSDDLLVATLFANRTPEYRDTVGFLANMVLLRTRLSPGGGLTDDLRATHSTVMDAFVHQAMPIQMLPITPDDTSRRLDDVVFQMMPDPVYSTRAGGLDIEVLVPDDVATRFELELVAVPTEDTIRVLLFFNPDRFSHEFAHELLATYIGICHGFDRLHRGVKEGSA
ncbi:Condensation domain-containing protein [Actinopolyspora alba]|uniref:Condensation domain-containing protein n=1 Tax=Actinopolyspora alba TaxID=673379 RepID=A0A1I2AWX7_9ACTN|nr:condensation domain-containing protein [Actinopolyspora alba]SFE48464.1 Condensation domain-containing protein [Actinopolyspora alba]